MRKYSAIIYDNNMKRLAYLQNAFDVWYDLKLNELWTCGFKLPADDKKNIYCKAYNYVELFDGDERVELFRIMPNRFTRENKKSIQYDCEHVLSTLFDDVLFLYHQIGNLGIYTKQVIRYVLDKQAVKRWQLAECDFSRQFEYKWENENLLAAIFSIPQPFTEKYRWEFETTGYPWRISLKKINTKYKSDIQYRKNMKSIIKTEDPTNLVTRLFLLGYGEGDNQLNIKSVNNNIPYLEKNIAKYGIKSSILVDRRFEHPETLKEYGRSILNELSEPFTSYEVNTADLYRLNKHKYERFIPGDFTLVKDLEDNINLQTQIIRVRKDDVTGNFFDIKIEVANKSKNVTSTISELQNRARISDTYSQGATNLQQINYADNADYNKPLKLKFYVPAEMVRINKLILNYTIENFRAYSKAVKGGGGTTTTTTWSGNSYTSTSAGGGNYTSTGSGGGGVQTTGVDNYTGGYGHNHGIPNGTVLVAQNGAWYTWVQSGDHNHTVEIPSHSHSVQISEHSHTVQIDGHNHSFNLPDHTHEIDYGIYEGGRADNCYLRIDGHTVDNYSQEINIIPYLSKDGGGKIQRGTWHTVEIIPDKLTRINASLFIQLFTNSRGGGDF